MKNPVIFLKRVVSLVLDGVMNMNDKIRTWLLWALPRIRYFAVAFIKVIYLYLFMLYERRSSLEGLIIVYGLMVVILFIPHPHADELPVTDKLLSWLSVLIILYALHEYLTGLYGLSPTLVCV